MDELGNILREAREAKGLSIAEVYDQIRISKRFLEALENGQYDVLPTPVHIRGYLRNYARFLDLDPKPLLDRYERTVIAPPAPAPPSSKTQPAVMAEPLPLRDDQPFFDPVSVELSPVNTGGDSGATTRLVIIAAFLIALGLIAYRFVPMMLGDVDPAPAIQDALANLFAEEEVTPEATSALTVAGEAGNDTSRNAIDADTTPVATSVSVDIPTAVPTRPTLPILDEINLRVDITERTWLQITVDGEVQFQGIARANDKFEFVALDRVELSAGNAIGVFVTINDVDLGRLGERGQDYTEEWRTNAGG